MMRISDGKIGTREFLSIVLFTIAIKFSDTTPDLLFQFGQNAAWMMPILSCLMILIPLLILLRLLHKHHNQGLMDIVFTLAGKYGGSMIGFVLFLIMFSGCVLNSRIYIHIVSTMYYQRTPIPILFFLFLAICYFVANRGLETIGRVAWLVLPYILIIAVFLILFVLQESDLHHLFPIAGPGLKTIAARSASYSSIFGEIILLAAFLPHVRTYKEFRFATILGLVVGSIQIAFYMALYVMIFDYPAVDQLIYPFHQLARAASIGQTITNVEILFFAFWIIASAIHFSILLYLTAFLFGKMLRMNEFEPLLLSFGGLILMFGLLPDNAVNATRLREWLLQGASAFLLGLPFLLWILDLWKGRGKA